eukprot:7819503-Pyramimonas_sp.AAC.1
MSHKLPMISSPEFGLESVYKWMVRRPTLGRLHGPTLNIRLSMLITAMSNLGRAAYSCALLG